MRPLLTAAMAGWLVAAVGASGAEPPPAGVSVAADGHTVSIQTDGGDCRDLMVSLCRRIGARLYWDPGIRRTVTAHASGLPIEQAIVRLLGPLNYGIIWRDDPAAGPSVFMPTEIMVYRDGMKNDVALTFDGTATVETPATTTNDIPQLAAAISATGDVRRCVSAARALAAMGTPAAVGALLDALGTLPPGEPGDQIALIAGGVTNREAARLLSERLMSSEDPRVVLAAERGLGATADGALLRDLYRAHGGDPTGRGYLRLTETLAGVTSRDAEQAVSDFAGPRNQAPATPIARAAVTSLSRIGTATAADQLVERLDLATAETGADLAAAVSGVTPTPESLAALRFAAAGNSAAQKDSTRIAAIRGLARFPDSQTVALMRQLAADPSPAVRDEAGRLLRFLEGDAP